MMYEFKVSEMAEDFGVTQTVISNWIKSGSVAAKEGPGGNYLMALSDYHSLCNRFGREPSIKPSSHATLEAYHALDEDLTAQEPLVLGGEHSALYDDPSWADSCMTCGTCASACPITGVEGLDPRKIVRMAFMGLDDELVNSKWPWMCTMCGKCEVSCPANIQITALMRKIRGTRERDLVPGPIHKGVAMCLERGNNLGIPKDDFVFLCEDIGEELAEESCPGFKTPIDVEGAKVMVTINSKEPFGEPDDMKWWWKIFHAAGESWTIPSEYWEGVNWGLFSGDDESQKEVVRRLVENMRRLKCEVLLLPE